VYSAFPFEEEYLLAEGINVRVLRVDENVVIDSKATQAQRKKYDGQTINIVYLYNRVPAFGL